MSEPQFFELQRAFTRYLRDPAKHPAPSVQADGLAVYAHAVISNMENFVADNFPRLKAIMTDVQFTAMVRDYYARHTSATPLFVELPTEFLRYLEELREEPDDPPFLIELAHFDLLENLISTDERRLEDVTADANGDLMAAVPLINPTTQLVRYTFPVHAIDVDYQPQDPPDAPTFIVAFRDRGHHFGFIDVNPATARLVELMLGDVKLNGEDLLKELAREMQHPNPAAVVSGGRETLLRLVERNVILGAAL